VCGYKNINIRVRRPHRRKQPGGGPCLGWLSDPCPPSKRERERERERDHREMLERERERERERDQSDCEEPEEVVVNLGGRMFS